MRVAFLILVVAGLVGCASPQYQTTVRLIPPVDAPGRACVATCENQKNICQLECQARRQACAKALDPQVEAGYQEALKQYELELQQYAMALRHYEMQLQFEWLHYGSSGYGYGWWGSWPGWYFPPPYFNPQMPTREGVRTALEQANCQDDCGCLPAYDGCFVGCGGQRVSETTCIKHCPSGK